MGKTWPICTAQNSIDLGESIHKKRVDQVHPHGSNPTAQDQTAIWIRIDTVCSHRSNSVDLNRVTGSRHATSRLSATSASGTSIVPRQLTRQQNLTTPSMLDATPTKVSDPNTSATTSTCVADSTTPAFSQTLSCQQYRRLCHVNLFTRHCHDSKLRDWSCFTIH